MKFTIKLILFSLFLTPSLFSAHIAKMAVELHIKPDFSERARKFFDENHKPEGLGEVLQYDSPYDITSPILIENNNLFIIFKGGKFPVREAPGRIVEEIRQLYTPFSSHTQISKGALYQIKGFINFPDKSIPESYFNILSIKISN